MEKEKLEAIKAELGPEFAEYFSGPIFDEKRLEFWLNELKSKNESAEKAKPEDNVDDAMRDMAIMYLLSKGEL